MRKLKWMLLGLCAALLLSACASPNAINSSMSGDESLSLRDQVEALTGKVEQLQDKIRELERENQSLLRDASESAAEDLTYLLNVISQSGETVTAYPALITAIQSAGDDHYTLAIDRLEYNPDYRPGSDEAYLINAVARTEEIPADRFTYLHYGGYLLPELDESFADYLSDGGAAFTVYQLGSRAIYLDEIVIP